MRGQICRAPAVAFSASIISPAADAGEASRRRLVGCRHQTGYFRPLPLTPKVNCRDRGSFFDMD